MKPYLHTVFCAPDRQELLQLVSRPPEQWTQARVLKHDRGTTVTLLTLPTGTVVIKHHRLHTWRRWGDALWHGSPARRAWQGAQLLQANGFLVPRPLAAFEQRTAGTLRESWYCSEGLQTQVPLDRYWRDQQKHWTRLQRRAFLQSLAEFLRLFHTAGLYAGDMRDANLLVEDAGNSHWQFYLVDLDRVVHNERLSQKRRLKNLVQLERTLGRRVHASERLFFLYQYLGAPLPPPAQRRTLLRRLLRLRKRKDREYARRRARHASGATGTVASPGPGQVSLQPARTQPHAPISCCIVCYNEERNIRRCLESVKWCDELVIVDSFSSDRTVEICQDYPTRVIQRAWPGYVEQKRFALSQALHEWVLNVDADEEVSPELRDEILAVLQRNDPAVDGFYVPRLVYYLGRWWWRGWYPGYRLRLFRKPRVRWGGVNPHEKVLLRGQADRLHGNLYHYTYEDLHDHLQAINGLTEIAAHEMALRGKRARLSHLVLHPFWRFLRFYFLRGGIRDGLPGFLVAATSAFYVFLKYAKLRECAGEQDYEQAQDSAHRSREALGRRREPSAGSDDVPHPHRAPLGSRH
ncbi:MAG: glycosyltransferase [Deltaproteobacteria bacterium]|nr:glycosyltransferase [Deltaproteobacteria bacterium]